MDFLSKNNQKIIVPIIIIVFVLILIFIFLFSTPTNQDKDIINKLLPEAPCISEDDSNSYAIALDTKNLNECKCISDENKAELCIQLVTDGLLYQRARQTFNVSMCDEISDPIVIEACKNGVQQGVDYVIEELGESQLAYYYFKAANYDGAIEVLEGKFELVQGNENPGDLLLLALSYANKALIENKQNELTPKAIEIVDKAIGLSVTDIDRSEAYRIKAFIYEVQPNINESINLYTTSIELNESNISSYVGRGHAFNKLGALDSAVNDFEKAKSFDLKNEYYDIYVQLCRLYSTNSEKTQNAIENCNFVLDNFSSVISGDNLAGVNLTLAGLYLRADRLDEAITKYQLALTYFPESTDALAGLARAYSINEEFEKAKKYSKKAIEINSLKAVAYREYAYSLFYLDEIDLAIDAALKGVDSVDKDASLLVSEKNFVKKDLYYILSDIYYYKEDSTNGSKYKNLGDEIN